MSVPQTMFQLLALLALVVPGITFSVLRRRLIGPGTDEKDFSIRLSRAIAASVVLNCLYIALGWPLVKEFWTKDAQGTPGYLQHPQKAAVAVLLLAFVIPALCAFAGQIRIRRVEKEQTDGRKVTRTEVGLAPIWHPAPSAWDAHAPALGGHFVSIRTGDGAWVGGYVPDGEGYVSTYPEPRDIFIPMPYEFDDEGAFLVPVLNARGLFVPLTGSERVYWFADGTQRTAEIEPDEQPTQEDREQS